MLRVGEERIRRAGMQKAAPATETRMHGSVGEQLCPSHPNRPSFVLCRGIAQMVTVFCRLFCVVCVAEVEYVL